MYSFNFTITKVLQSIGINIENIAASGIISILYTCNTCREYYVNILYVRYL